MDVGELVRFWASGAETWGWPARLESALSRGSLNAAHASSYRVTSQARLPSP